jgi:alkanesulfonate monooxygenase SsuD/methylene tetrahydromethanopterin reductase-like flavin-dependent oxidoreductase (luciferase family)
VAIYNGIGRSLDPFLEGYTSMGFLAGLTQDMTLTMLVTGVTYRYPGVLAKTVTTLDALSGGRSMFGIGAAWYEREHLALGVPYPPVAERFEMLEETLQICNQMWSVDDYLRTLDRFAALGVDLINTGPHPGNPDPVGWVKRLGDEVIPRLAS